jgi:hypothetical protein
MTCSFYCYNVEFVLVELVESCVLISYTPVTPVPNRLSMKLFNILLCVSERHDIIKVTAEKPDSYTIV